MEDSQIKQDDNMVIAEMIRNADVAPEPGTRAEVIHSGDEEVPVEMTLAQLTSAGWCYIYERLTGERSIANKNMLGQLLKVKEDDGSFRFTTVKPINPPFPIKRGTLKCILHKDDPNRMHYTELGMPECPKSNLTSPYQVRRHMLKKHPDQWRDIEQERTDRERKEDRDLQMAILGRAKPTEDIGTPEAPLYVSDKDKRKVKK